MPEDARDTVKRDNNAKATYVEFPDPVKFLSTVAFTELPETPVLSAQAAATSISVLNTEKIKLQSTGSVTLTDFTDGQEGQTIFVSGDGFTTATHGTKIKTNTAANKLLAANQVYIFTRISSVWIEASAPSTTSYTAGTGLALSGTTFSNKYVGKSATLIASSVTTTLSAGNTVHAGATGRYAIRMDTTNMGNVRVSASTDGSGATGNHVLDLYYSSNGGSSWNLISMSITITNTSGQLVTGTAALPGGAVGSAIWFSPALTSTSTTGNNILYTYAVELTP